MLPTTPAGQRGAPSASGRIGTAGTPICRSALRAQYRTVPNSRRRSPTASATTAASLGNIVDSGASENISAHADSGISEPIITRPRPPSLQTSWLYLISSSSRLPRWRIAKRREAALRRT